MRAHAALDLFCFMIVATAHLGCATQVEGGCASDADCAAGEVCDSASNRCISGGDTGPMPDGAIADAAPRDGVAAHDAPNDVALEEILPECDLDGDRVQGAQCGGDDCDEADAAVHPGATELCNAADEDCDGIVDEQCDDDGDGFCDADLDPDNCDDCCDDTAEAKPGQVNYFTAPTDCGDFDYDCDGAEEMVTTATSGTCPCSGGAICSGGTPPNWWSVTVPACGDTGWLYTCGGSCPCPNLFMGTQVCR